MEAHEIRQLKEALTNITILTKRYGKEEIIKQKNALLKEVVKSVLKRETWRKEYDNNRA